MVFWGENPFLMICPDRALTYAINEVNNNIKVFSKQKSSFTESYFYNFLSHPD